MTTTIPICRSLYLQLGVCVENLSNHRATEPLQNISSCLQAIHTLLDDLWPRRQLVADPSLPIELLNVLHRLLLTRENLSTHLQVISVVKQIIKAMQEKIEGQRKVKGEKNGLIRSYFH